jgi:hypothetical protein
MILEVAKALIPPQDPNPSVTIYRWLMWATVMSLMLAVGWLIVNTASAGDLASLKADVAGNKKAQLESQIFQKSIDSCMSDGGLKIANQQELARLVGEWRSLVKDNGANPPTLKSCTDLGIAQ